MLSNNIQPTRALPRQRLNIYIYSLRFPHCVIHKAPLRSNFFLVKLAYIEANSLTSETNRTR